MPFAARKPGPADMLYVMAVDNEYGPHLRSRITPLLTGVGPVEAAIVVTHDLAVARLLAQRTLVMQGGRVVESGLTDQILDDPQHPYTQLLVSSILQS